MRLDVQGDRKVQEIRIVPGKNDAPGSFAENARPKTIRVTLSDGTSSVITLADEPSLQKFPVSGMAEWVRVDILDSYAGSKGTDTYISDISFGNRPAPAFDTFDALIAGTTSAENPSTTASSPGAPFSSEVSPSPTAPSAEPAGPGDPGGRSVWTIWPIVALAVAGAALVTAIVLATILLTRRTGPSA